MTTPPTTEVLLIISALTTSAVTIIAALRSKVTAKELNEKADMAVKHTAASVEKLDKIDVQTNGTLSDLRSQLQQRDNELAALRSTIDMLSRAIASQASRRIDDPNHGQVTRP